jgi:hypothetical protein
MNFLVGERVAAALERGVERSVPVLRVARREGTATQQFVIERSVLVRDQRGCVAVEGIVGALGAVWGFESRLHLEVMTQEPQNRSDQIFFRLRLIVARRVGIEDA